MSLLDAMLLDPYRIDVWIACRTDNVKGSGTQADPWDGSTAAKFDVLMNQFAVPGTNTKVQIHLGPGTFQTHGYSDDDVANSWQAKPGMKIVGSGFEVTTLKLVNTALSSTHLFAIGHQLSTGSAPVVPNPVDFFAISDLTIDCNLAAQSGTVVACDPLPSNSAP